MVHNRELFQAILDDPDDDSLRLVYADWLEEHGDADRAEFIRAQVELAQPPLPRGRTRRLVLEKRVQTLWKQHGPKWGLEPGGGDPNLRSWSRGFCDWCHIDRRAIVLELPQRLAQAPIQKLSTSVTRDDVVQLLTLPDVARLKGLCLFAASAFGRDRPALLSDADVRLFTECPYLARLEALDLSQHEIGTEGFRQLTHAVNMPALRDLELYGNRWSDEGLAVVAASPLAPRLRKLHAGGGRAGTINASGVRTLAHTPALANLRVLNLDNANLGDAGARHIAKSRHLSGLTELWLHMCEIRNAGVQTIAVSPHLANLEVLDLTSNWTVGHPAAVALVESPYLKKIRSLDLWRCEGMSRADEQLLRKRFRSRVNFARSY